MHVSTLFSAAVTLSLCLPAYASPWPFQNLDPRTCDSNPSAKAESVPVAELDKAVVKYFPKADGKNCTGVNGNKPKKIPLEAEPKTRILKSLNFDQLNTLGLNKTSLFLRKEVQNRATWPWCTIGKIQIFDLKNKFLGGCTGTVVGRNLMVTASHCVPWGQGSGKWRMSFTPAFNGEDPANSAPFGTSWVNKCKGVRNTDDVTGLDYVICQLNSNMGDTTGFMGWQASSGNNFYLDGKWTSVGYPGDSHSGLIQMVEDAIKLDDVDDEGSDGKELESYVYSSPGWSGGPLFHMLNGNDPRIVGVLSGYEEEFSFWDLFIAKHSVSAGGLHLAKLIAYGRESWKP